MRSKTLNESEKVTVYRNLVKVLSLAYNIYGENDKIFVRLYDEFGDKLYYNITM